MGGLSGREASEGKDGDVVVLAEALSCFSGVGYIG